MNFFRRANSRIACAAGLLFLVSANATVLAQRTRGPYKDIPKLPDGIYGQRITELLETINANDPARVRKFVESAFTAGFRNYAPMENHVAVFGQMYTSNRGLTFHSIREYENPAPAGEYTVIARSELTQGWKGIDMQIETTPPHRIAGLQFAPARPPSDLPNDIEKLSDAQIASRLEAFVQRLVDLDAFSGTILLAKNGKVLFQRAYGLASKRFNAPNKIDTKFNLGSMNKMFTGVAIAQLAQRGKLSLDDTLDKYLSTDWLSHDITSKIKIKHLLTHTSGLAYVGAGELLQR